MNKIIVLDIKFKFGEVEDVIHPVVLKDNSNMVLIDCGYSGFLPAIEQAMEEKNLSCSNLTHILITHQDHDHMGALSEFEKKYPEIQIIAGKKESPYISGQLKFLRLEQAEAMQPNLPEEQKAFGLAFCNILKNVQTSSVDVEVQDGNYFDWCGGCTIIETPGHTPGHISVYVNQKKVMITGDAAVIENGELVIANPQFTLDIKKAEESLHKIMNYGAKEIVCYHGGVMKEDKRFFKSTDEYIAAFSPEIQEKLQTLRKVIKEAAPQATEKISYGLPAFVLNGNLVYFAAFKNHIGFYPTPNGIDSFKEELSKYKGAKGSVQFPLDKPLPLDLVRRIVAFRVAENERLAQEKRKKKK